MKDRLDSTGDTERDALWDLLGKAEAPRVSPYFARRVIREAARLQEERGWWGFLRGEGWRPPQAARSGAAVAAIVCVVTLALTLHPGRVDLAQSDAREEINPGDVEVIANLDNLMAYEENRLWTDESNAD